MLNIVIPMAGSGSRFLAAGFKEPKPLIDVLGKKMIELVINNLKPNTPHKFIFICQNEHIEKYNLTETFTNICDNFEMIGIDGITEGAAITVLKARALIDNESPLMIANSDQWLDMDINAYLADFASRDLTGGMVTMKASDPKWSYAKQDNAGYVTEVIEKVVVSDEATVGVYNFAQGHYFCKYADYMIEHDIRSKGEFYVAPVFSFMANDKHKIGVYNIGAERNGMYGLGIPSDLALFKELEIAKVATAF
ncbi:glycosyltransferase family 2 protein [Oceanisphaera avium]|uniref:Glycosyl transferase family 2 n=1 Tax=Oceanisphaera avium TaxID=1903694 RepID=A0A1Y0CVA6_9GAMM|nr:glycosyltransferase family 2 protein [Oceanisphaera avium]ART78815.1 glycosyl transferase family 2 [Oceanisphaera avium]